MKFSVQDAPHPVERKSLPPTEEPERHPVRFDEDAIDQDVRRAIRRLRAAGHEAFIVGGCVRDLLLQKHPKDFDITTSARPEEVRKLFRNSRIIGRRFRLVHLLFGGGKVIEVATYRASPEEIGDGEAELIRSDNTFGTNVEDARRRDFRMNGLFYDPEAGEILDWVGGMQDIHARVVHTIGDPIVRFREDPVRILRAIKFAGRLDLGMTPDVYDAIVTTRHALNQASKPRVSEEILRLLRGGQSRRTIYLAWETGVLDVLLPELSALLSDRDAFDGAADRVWRILSHLDHMVQTNGPLDDTVLWTLLLLEPLKEACDAGRDRGRAATEFLMPIATRWMLSRRFMDGMRRILAVLPRLHAGKVGRFSATDIFPMAVEVFEAELVGAELSLAPAERLRREVPPKRRRGPTRPPMRR